MTVGELIELLKQVPPQLEVAVVDPGQDGCDGFWREAAVSGAVMDRCDSESWCEYRDGEALVVIARPWDFREEWPSLADLGPDPK